MLEDPAQARILQDDGPPRRSTLRAKDKASGKSPSVPTPAPASVPSVEETGAALDEKPRTEINDDIPDGNDGFTMSQEPPAKRQRVDDGGVAAHAAPAISIERIGELRTKIVALSPASMQAITTAVVMKEPSGLLASLIDLEHARVLGQERVRAAQAISFAQYAEKADWVLNEKYSHLSGSKQFEASGDAQFAVQAMLDVIVERTKDFSAYATKKSAVETMRSIFDIMLESNGVIGDEVRKDCRDWDSKFLQVMGKFTEPELERLATENGGAWVEQFRALVSNANGYCVLEKLQQSLDDLESYQVGDEDEDEDDQDEDDEDNEDEA